MVTNNQAVKYYINENIASLIDLIRPQYDKFVLMETIVVPEFQKEFRDSYYETAFFILIGEVSKQTGISLEECYAVIDNPKELIDALMTTDWGQHTNG